MPLNNFPDFQESPRLSVERRLAILESAVGRLGTYSSSGLDAIAQFPGTYNLQKGLQNWRYSWSRMGKNGAGSGLGGSGVVVMFDSIGGAYASSYLWDVWPHRLRNKLQNHFNPEDVQGGFGYVPIILSNNDTGWTRSDEPSGQPNTWVWTADTVGSWTLEGGTGYHAGMRRVRTATNGAATRLRLAFNGSATDAVRKRLNITDIELITSTFVNDGTITWDSLTSDAFVDIAAGGTTGTIVGNAATNYSVHNGRQLSGLTRTDTNGIQIGVASGTATCRPDGAFLYDNDFDCGCWLANLSLNGARADYIAGTAATLSANITKWGATAPGGTPAGATQAGLFMSDFLLNDVGLNAAVTITLADYVTYYTTLITTAQACASMPSYLIVIPQIRNNANTIANCLPYIEALYDLADTYNCGLINFNTFFGDVGYTATPTDIGIVGGPSSQTSGDGTHYNDRGQELMAQAFFSILSR